MIRFNDDQHGTIVNTNTTETSSTDIIKPVILIDGSNFLFRAYHGLPPLTAPSGEPSGAIFGTLTMLRKLMTRYQPEKMAVVFDAKGTSFRNELYAEYKANRPPMPDDLRSQIQPLHAIIKAMGVPLICHDGVEADDVIGTLSTQAAEHNTPVLIVSSDKDLAQLVTDNVKMLDGIKYTLRGVDEINEKFGVGPEKIVDLLALMGDSADNIPGVPSVGPKTAVKWLNQYGSVEAIIENANDIKGKVGEKLRDNLDNLRLSKRLATIDLAVDIEETLSSINLLPPDNATLRSYYEQYNFKRWLDETISAASDTDSTSPDAKQSQSAPATIECDYQMITDQTALDQLIRTLYDKGTFSLDTETTSLNYRDARIVGISIAYAPYQAYYIPFGHDYDDAPTQLPTDTVLSAFKPILEDASIGKVGQHIKYDMHIFANVGIHLRGIVDDTMLASYCYDSVATKHDMESLAQHYLQAETTSFSDIAGKGAKQLTFNQIPLEQATHYAAEDADITWRLREALTDKLQSISPTSTPDFGPEYIYRQIELPTMRVLQKMEYQGVLVDVHKLAALSEQHHLRLQALEEEAHKMAGEEFNLGSTSQLKTILFDQLALPIIKKTPKGMPSTDEEVLERLASEHELPRLILEHRSLSKLKNTYTDVLPTMVSDQSGRVHTSYHQANASTGRLSSSAPNLQNIPIRTQAGREIRTAFVAPKNYVVLAADYSQIELRIMAHISGDERLVEAFKQGEDIHQATAREVFGTDENGEVTDENRRAAKAINFGLIYGMGAFGLARQLGIKRDEANQYIHHYFERYPGVKAYMESIRKQAKEQGYVETIFGRRLYLPAMKGRDARAKQAAERLAINAPMQGSAADIIKLAMMAVDQAITSAKLKSRMVMQVHDEIVFEAHKSEIDQLETIIQSEMTNVASLSVPLVVDTGHGENWEQAH